MPTRFRALVAFALCLAIDASAARADFVFAARDNNTITKIDTTTGVETVFASTKLNIPNGIAADISGNIYVANAGDGTITKFTVAGVGTTIATGLGNPQGMIADPFGNLYVANRSDNTVVKYTASTGLLSNFASNLSLPAGLAFDPSGNLYVANQQANSITKVAPGGAVSTFATAANGLNNPTGLAIDSLGNVYVANLATATIVELTPQGTTSVFANAGLSFPKGLAFDSKGNLYAANGDGTIEKFTPGGVGTVFSSGTAGTPTYLTTVPEPASLALLGLGLALIAARFARKSR